MIKSLPLLEKNHGDKDKWQHYQGVKGGLMDELKDDESKSIFQSKPYFSSFLTLTMKLQVREPV